MAGTRDKKDKAQRILKAARSVLARQGYAAATISQVAAEAKVSRGLLHYYFKNKEEMLAKVVRETVSGSAEMARDIFRDATGPEQIAERICGAIMAFVQAEPEFSAIFFESWGIARQSKLVERELKSLYAEFRRAVFEGLCQAQERGVINPVLGLAGVAIAITALIDGISLQLLTDPSLATREGLWETGKKSICFMLQGG